MFLTQNILKVLLELYRISLCGKLNWINGDIYAKRDKFLYMKVFMKGMKLNKFWYQDWKKGDKKSTKCGRNERKEKGKGTIGKQGKEAGETGWGKSKGEGRTRRKGRVDKRKEENIDGEERNMEEEETKNRNQLRENNKRRKGRKK